MTFQYDEFQGLATDFHDPKQVETYDARQKTSVEWEEKLVRELGITSSSIVIELGPGTGAFSLAAAQVCDTVFSVDISIAMLDYAQKNAAKEGVRNISYFQAGFLTYQHEGPLADFVVTQFALHHLPDFWKAVALQRIAQFMKPGATFYLRDVIFSFDVRAAQTELESWIDGLLKSGSFSRADLEGHIRDEHSTFDWVMDDLFSRTGFLVTKKEIQSPIYARYRAVKL